MTASPRTISEIQATTALHCGPVRKGTLSEHDSGPLIASVPRRGPGPRLGTSGEPFTDRHPAPHCGHTHNGPDSSVGVDSVMAWGSLVFPGSAKHSGNSAARRCDERTDAQVKPSA